MLDQLKSEGASGGGAQSRLRLYVAGLLVLGAVIVGITQFTGKPGPERLPGARPSPEKEAARKPVIDPARLPDTDDQATHARYQSAAIDYLLGVVELDLSPLASPLAIEALGALPFAEARGRVFEVEGTVEEILREEYQTPAQRLWSVVLASDGGERVIVLKHGLDSDPREGRPEDALRVSTEYLEAGDRVLVRGVYLQRRTGTFGQAILREPAPVLVATPPATGFRKVAPAAVVVADPTEADWAEVKDRFLSETQRWEEPALFQVVQWARAQGHARLLEDIRAGRLVARPWGRELFDRWGAEVELVDPDAPRPVTEELRGGLFRTTGLLGSFQREGWETLPRVASAWGVNELYLLDLVGDYWGNQALRNWSVFPLSTYATVKGDKWEHVVVYGFFLKNYTYETRKSRDGTVAAVTMPMFVVIHMEPVEHEGPRFGTLIWIISGVIVGLAVVFFFVLIRGERKERARLHAYRRDLRRRVRGQPPASTPASGGDPDVPPPASAAADATPPSPDA